MVNVPSLEWNWVKMIGTAIIKIHIIFQKMIHISNLVILHESVHRLVHMKDKDKIKAY